MHPCPLLQISNSDELQPIENLRRTTIKMKRNLARSMLRTHTHTEPQKWEWVKPKKRKYIEITGGKAERVGVSCSPARGKLQPEHYSCRFKKPRQNWRTCIRSLSLSLLSLLYFFPKPLLLCIITTVLSIRENLKENLEKCAVLSFSLFSNTAEIFALTPQEKITPSSPHYGSLTSVPSSGFQTWDR